jgi:hypothetical protein
MMPGFIKSQGEFKWTPMIQQTALHFGSESITIEGYGLGIGTQLVWKEKFVFQPDMNLLWLNGNAISNRFAFGYQRKGKWNPAAMATFNLLWGQHTEVIVGEGERLAMPVWVAGLRVTPLRFELPKGFISVLELGYGFGPYKGNCYELTLINIGSRW